ncbi:MAG: M20/M25/M40 family metallo-hydrolase [Elusimicrobia bacterium]|nr:M20/M25/M40 family metallo-hydrolase [Elusimicrobiota bacterium]
MNLNINRKRMIENFVRFAKISSISGREGKAAELAERVFKTLEAKICFDNAGRKISAQTGNMFALFDGDPGTKPILLSAHLDTVGPCENVKPTVKRDRIVSDGTTVLGADCKAGIAIIIEALSVLKENKIPRPPIEVVLSISEEVGLLGAKFLDYSKIKSKYGIIFDNEKPLNEVVTNAPAANKLDIKIYGMEAHAGVCPEKGISAIKIAAGALAGMKLGRIDFETTANIGIIKGGTATNIITPLVELKGEARSHSIKKLEKQTRHMEERFRIEINRARQRLNGGSGRVHPSGIGAIGASRKAAFHGVRCEFNASRSFPNLRIPGNSPILNVIKSSLNELGMRMQTKASGGGTDANIFYGRGIEAPNLGTGMRDVHTTGEYLDLEDFFNCAKLTLKIITTWR